VKNFTALISVNESIAGIAVDAAIELAGVAIQHGSRTSEFPRASAAKTFDNSQRAIGRARFTRSLFGRRGVNTRTFSIEGRPGTKRGEVRSAIVQTISATIWI